MCGRVSLLGVDEAGEEDWVPGNNPHLHFRTFSKTFLYGRIWIGPSIRSSVRPFVILPPVRQCPSVCPSLRRRPSVRPSVHPFHLSNCPSVHLFFPSVRPCIHYSIHSSIHQSILPRIHIFIRSCFYALVRSFIQPFIY
jgi:hypothetical protein